MITVTLRENEGGPWITIRANTIDEAVEMMASINREWWPKVIIGGALDGTTS